MSPSLCCRSGRANFLCEVSPGSVVPVSSLCRACPLSRTSCRAHMNLHGLRAERELFLGSCDVDADDGFEEYQRRQRAAVPAASNTSSGHNSRVDGAAPSAAPSAAPAKPSLELQAEAEARSRADARRRAQEREGRLQATAAATSGLPKSLGPPLTPSEIAAELKASRRAMTEETVDFVQAWRS